jgi:serine phosphatase RsbU (regulator of sigma subunit)
VIDSSSPRTEFAAYEVQATRWNSPAGQAAAGGDWCDVVAVDEGILALTVGDVSGHGESAAATMDLLRAIIVEAVQAGPRAPSTILATANSQAYNGGEGIIATAIVGFLDQRRRTFTFASAGHPPPLVFSGSRHAFLSHSPGDLPLGIFPLHHAAVYALALPPDVLLTLYTDGVTEHKRNLLTGERELARACRHAYERPDLDAAHCIAEHVFRTGRGSDDAAVLAVRTWPSAARFPASDASRSVGAIAPGDSRWSPR